MSSDPFAPMSLALTIAPPIRQQALDPSLELRGRGYARPPTGPFRVTGLGAAYINILPIHWPQAKDDWGPAPWTVLVRDLDNVALESSPNPPGYIVRAADQPRIAPGGLLLEGVPPHTPRPYGAGRYNLGPYSVWPPDGATYFEAALMEFAWAQQPDSCAAWLPPPLVIAGGCVV